MYDDPRCDDPRWRRAWQPCCELRENSAVFRMFYCYFVVYVLDVVSITVYDRDTLLNIGSFVTQRKPDFEFLNAGALFTDTASEPFVWVAPSSLRGSPCTARTERKSSRGKAEVGAFVSLSTTRGVMQGICTLLNPSAPLIWNFICFCVDHSGY